jgi:hypothetical protein
MYTQVVPIPWYVGGFEDEVRVHAYIHVCRVRQAAQIGGIVGTYILHHACAYRLIGQKDTAIVHDYYILAVHACNARNSARCRSLFLLNA